MADDQAWKRLHPASLVVNLLPTAWRTIRAAWPLLLAGVVGGVQGAIDLTFVMLFLALAVSRTVLHFATLRYRLHDGKLEIHHGLISRVHRTVDPARIQNVEIVQNLFHKAAGLVELRIEMAGDTGLAASEGLLSALSVAEAEALRTQLGRTGSHVTAAESGEAFDAPGLLEVVGYGVSAGRVGTAAIVVGVGFDAMAQLSPGSVASTTSMGPLALLGLVLLATAGGYVFSVGSAILRLFNHRWWRVGQSLHFESGLFTRRRMDIPLAKLQLVRASEPILRRAMGYATLFLDTAAANSPGEGTATEGFVPMVPREELVERIQQAFPALDTPIDGALAPCAPRAVYRTSLSGALRWLIPAAVAHLWLGLPWAWALLPFGAVTGFLDARRQGWAVTDRFVVVRRGYLSRETWVLPRAKVQSVRWEQGPLMRYHGLGRVIVWFPGGRLALPDVRVADAERIFGQLTGR